MIVCGIEEPAGYNEYLDFNPRSEGVEELCLAAAAAPTMNRYGFVWFGDHAELPSFVSNVGRYILSPIGAVGSLIEFGETPDRGAQGYIRGRAWLSRMETAGCETSQLGELSVAIRKGGIQDLLLSLSDDCVFKGNGKAVVLDQQLGEKEVLPTGLKFAEGTRLIPSEMAPPREAVRWLSRHQHDFIYFERDQIGRVGIVLMTHAKLDLAALAEQLTVVEVFDGSKSHLPWIHGPGEPKC